MKFIRTSGRIYLESLKITSYLQRLVKDNEVLSQTWFKKKEKGVFENNLIQANGRPKEL